MERKIIGLVIQMQQLRQRILHTEATMHTTNSIYDVAYWTGLQRSWCLTTFMYIVCCCGRFDISSLYL